MQINKIFKSIFKIIGVLIFIYILSKIDFSMMVHVIVNMNILYLIFAILCSILLVAIKTCRWQYINKFLYIKTPYLSAVKMSTVASALGMVTPGRLGELIKVKSIKKYSPDSATSWIGVLIDRIHDMIVLLFAGLLSAFFIAHIEFNLIYLYVILSAICIILLIFIYKFWEPALLWVFKRIFQQERYLTIKEKVSYFLEIFLGSFKGTFVKSFCYSIVAYSIQCIITMMIAYSLGVEVPFQVIFIVISVIAFASLIPITIGGLGTREGIYIYLLGQQGIPLETSLAIAFIDGILIFTFFIGFMAFIFWVTNRFSIEF
jgi:glycosyltransferase 2 family protein